MFPSILMFSSLSAAQYLLLPLVLIALIIDVAILVVWYFIGALLGNSTVKTAARNEFYQFIGTAILISVVLFFLVLGGSLFYSALSSTSLMNPSAIYNTISSLSSNTQLSILASGNSLANPSASSTYPGLVNLVAAAEKSSASNTIKIDYPLAATSVIVANLTNQTALNLNQMFYVDALLGFMSGLTPETIFCSSYGTPCYTPIALTGLLFSIEVDYTPYAGYELIYSSFRSLSVILATAYESFVAQLLVYTILLYIWPYLLFIGLVLRATFFTRKIGGLFIAAAVASVLILPLVFSVEYLSLGRGTQSSPLPSAFGFNAITTLPASSGTGNYILNFFVEPSIGAIATHNGCYPIISGYTTLAGAEMADIATTFIPIYNIVAAHIDQYLSSPSPYPLPVGCSDTSALHTLFDSLNLYGIIGVIAYFLPLINLLIFLSALQGLSGLMGGDTSLGGLARLI
jgi:hypothetical protein